METKAQPTAIRDPATERLTLRVADPEATGAGRRRAIAQLWAQNIDSDRIRLELDVALRSAIDRAVSAQLAFLEGMKIRVSIREKELMRLVDARKQENASLVDPLNDNRNILAHERNKLAMMEARLDELAQRADVLTDDLKELRAGADMVLVDEYRKSLRERAGEIRLRADEFSLDEAQALHLWEESSGQ